MALGARRQAEKRRVKFRGALSGPAGSGKTLGALKVARGLVGPEGLITVIDTERNSSELYADARRFPELGRFDVIEFTPPFTAAVYRQAIYEAQKGSEAIIIDSLSHAWTGQGGMLEQHGKAVDASRSKNSWEAWRHVTPDHDRLVDEMLACGCHLFVTLRTKTEWVTEKDENGRNKPVKIGLEPRFREGIDYEFTVVWDVRQEDHYASASKDRTALFSSFNDLLSVRTGEMIRGWVEDGGEPLPQPNPDDELVARIKAALAKAGDATTLERIIMHKDAVRLADRISDDYADALARVGHAQTDTDWTTSSEEAA